MAEYVYVNTFAVLRWCNGLFRVRAEMVELIGQLEDARSRELIRQYSILIEEMESRLHPFGPSSIVVFHTEADERDIYRETDVASVNRAILTEGQGYGGNVQVDDEPDGENLPGRWRQRAS